MVIQYPHILKVYKPANSSLVNGNWTQGAKELVFESQSRFEPNSRDQFVSDIDGKRVVFRGIVYMPHPSQIESSYVEEGVTRNTIVYAGENLVHIVTSDEAGGNTIHIPSLSGKKFNLSLDVLPLQNSEYTILPDGGFSVSSDIEPLITGQRFLISVYYEMTVSGLSGVATALGGDFYLDPGLLVEVWWGGKKLLSDNIKQFSKGQLNARVWV